MNILVCLLPRNYLLHWSWEHQSGVTQHFSWLKIMGDTMVSWPRIPAATRRATGINPLSLSATAQWQCLPNTRFERTMRVLHDPPSARSCVVSHNPDGLFMDSQGHYTKAMGGRGSLAGAACDRLWGHLSTTGCSHG